MSFSDFVTGHGSRISKQHYLNLIDVFKVDGKINPDEFVLLHKEGRKFGLTDGEIDKLINEKSYHPFHAPYSLEEKFEQLYNVATMILADEIVTEEEKKALKRIALEAGFNEEVIERLRPILIDGIQNNESEESILAKFKSELFKR